VKGVLLILLFTGELEFRAFDYSSTRLFMASDDEKIMACDARANDLREQISEHSYKDPRGQGWYLKDGSGTLQGHIC
jgi:hypothetical protein